jgi:hypothetical protein
MLKVKKPLVSPVMMATMRASEAGSGAPEPTEELKRDRTRKKNQLEQARDELVEWIVDCERDRVRRL